MVLERTLRYLVIAGIFALPFVCLLVSTSLFFPFITGKNFTFRVIVEIITGAWLALALVDTSYRPRRSWILGAFAVFVIVIAAADAFGANPFKSFWSNYERMDGWVTIAHLLLYIIVAASVLNTERLWRRLWQVSLGVSTAVGVYGILQLAGISALAGGGSAGLSVRIDARFGNPIYLAAYMLFHIFIAAMLWSQTWGERGQGKRLPASLWYGFAIALDTIVLFFTGTRGTILGLIGGALLSAFLLVVLARNSRIAWRVAASVVVLILVVSGGFWAARDAAWVHDIGFLERLATISTSDNTVKARFLNWRIAWQGVKERPLLGWGQENYAIVFDKYYDPQMYAQEPWFDRVHNIVFDWLVAGGFLGLIAYLSIFAVTLLTLWRGAFTTAERALFTGLLAAYFFHNFFVFDNITSYILFGTVLAYIVWRAGLAQGARALIEKRLLPKSTLPFVAAAGALVVWGAAWLVNAAALAENRTLIQAITPQQGGIEVNLGLFKQALTFGTYGTQEAREQLAQGASQVAGAQGVPASLKQEFFDTASHEMSLQASASPLDARFPLFLGILYDAYGDYADGAKALLHAHELSRNKQSILFEIALNQQTQGNNAGALQTFAAAYNLAPEYQQARILYAAALIRAGADQLADQVLAPIIVSGEAGDTRIVAAYLARKRYDKIAAIAEAHVKAQPQDVQGYFTLAAAYYGMGNTTKAIAALEQAKAVSPAVASQADALIQEVKNGTAKIGQ